MNTVAIIGKEGDNHEQNRTNKRNNGEGRDFEEGCRKKGADKEINKAIKKATKGSKRLPFKMNPHYVRNTDRRLIMKMTWEQICKKYKNQHVCLSNIEWTDRPHGNVKNAEVIASEEDTPYDELLLKAALSNGTVICRDTYEDIYSSVGVVELCS